MVRFTKHAALRYSLSDPDIQLMLQVRDGDLGAFEQLWAKYQDRVRFVLEHLMGNRQQTEDLAQEVFLRVYRARSTYVPTAKFSTWLFTIVNNVVSNARRSLCTRREVQLHGTNRIRGNLLENLKEDAVRHLPPSSLERSELCQMVRSAVDALSERQKIAVRLRNFEGLSHAEIAMKMNTSPDAIKSLLHRARVNLHGALEPYLDHGDLPGSRHAAVLPTS